MNPDTRKLGVSDWTYLASIANGRTVRIQATVDDTPKDLADRFVEVRRSAPSPWNYGPFNLAWAH